MTRNTCARPRAIFAAVLCAGLWTSAFGQGREFTATGELQSPGAIFYSQYTVELVDLNHRVPAAKVEVRSDGFAEFHGVLSGEYAATVSSVDGHLICEQVVSLSPQMSRFVMRMPEGKKMRPGAQTVSVKQLLRPPTKRAFRSFAEAQKFSSSGDYPHATEALQRALAESPDYGEAHINLGVQYSRTGRLEEAVKEFRHGMEIVGRNPVTLFNLAAVEAKLGRLQQGVEMAREGLRMDKESAQGHLVLGILLANDPRAKAEALVHLEKAAEAFPSALGVIESLRGK